MDYFRHHCFSFLLEKRLLRTRKLKFISFLYLTKAQLYSCELLVDFDSLILFINRSYFVFRAMSSSSGRKLHCEGPACAKCGRCRDWYWRFDGLQKVYAKRIGATCFYQYGGYRDHRGGYDHYFYDDCFGISSGNAEWDRKREARQGNGPLCECEDNRC